MPSCEHIEKAEAGGTKIRARTPEGCEECLKAGKDDWVQLRLCLNCGHVGCCDSSPGRHATQHFHVTGHLVIRSYEPGDNWEWCYIDEVIYQPPKRAAAPKAGKSGREKGPRTGGHGAEPEH